MWKGVFHEIGRKNWAEASKGSDDQKEAVGDVPSHESGTKIKQHVPHGFLVACHQTDQHQGEQDRGIEGFQHDVAAVGVGKDQAQKPNQQDADHGPQPEMRPGLAMTGKQQSRRQKSDENVKKFEMHHESMYKGG